MATRPAASSRRRSSHPMSSPVMRQSARTWTVALDGTADYSSIAEAVAAATDGDTISIAAGFYLESLHIDKAVHLVGPGDPRFVEEDIDTDEEPYALVMGLGSETVLWSANGGSIRDLIISRTTTVAVALAGSALIRQQAGALRVERCVLAEGAQRAVAADGGELSLVRCHIRQVNEGVVASESIVSLDRTHVEGADVLAMHLKSSSTATLTSNSFEGRTVLEGDVLGFAGNDIDMLVVHDTLNTAGNRMSTIVHVGDFLSQSLAPVSIPS
jgi:hypothetical protein